MADTPEATRPQPVSLTGHTVPPERLSIIKAHVEALARTALRVSDELPLEADVHDFVCVLEREEG
jgi:hypothetical protein